VAERPLEGARKPARAVFLSYASEDAQGAQRIADALKAAGIEVWFDKTALRGGDAWDQKIRQQIRDCALFIPIISAHSQARSEGYFRLEWRIADQRTQLMGRNRAFVVPVCVDDTSEKVADVPDSFMSVQWTRLPGGEASPTFASHVCALLASDTSAVFGIRSSLSTEGAPRRWMRAPRRLWSAVGLVTLLALAGGSWLVWRQANIHPPTAPIAAGENSIAVLPFVDLSEKRDQAYFADGLTEELIDLLTKVPNLSVAARTSSFYFKGKQVTIAEIRKALNVAYALEGSVREAGGKLRITAQLIRTDDERHLWSKTYDRDNGAVFEIQDEITHEVIQALRLVFQSRNSKRPATSWRAYQIFLEGEFHAYDMAMKSDADKAESAYRAVVAIDPSFAPAWEGLAATLMAQSDMHGADSTRMYAEARAAAQRAIDLDPVDADSHLTMASVLMNFDWDWKGADRELNGALRLEPSNPRVLRTIAWLAQIKGDWVKAVEYSQRALALDPLSAGAHESFAAALYCSGHYADSADEYRKSLQLAPEGGITQAMLGRSLMQAGKLQEALDIVSREPNPGYRLWSTAMIQYLMGRHADSTRTLTELQRLHPNGNEDGIAWVHAVRADLDDAFAWFDKAYASKATAVAFVKCMPEAPQFTRDPRYKDLLRKLNLPE
jgi:adenylate cyclase